jgi:hypothetical protein
MVGRGGVILKIKFKMISKNEFLKRVNALKSFQSVRGKNYVDLNIKGPTTSPRL